MTRKTDFDCSSISKLSRSEARWAIRSLVFARRLEGHTTHCDACKSKVSKLVSKDDAPSPASTRPSPSQIPRMGVQRKPRKLCALPASSDLALIG